jgi:acyl-coenzyme A thioesterase PaaI-like protein
VQDEAPAHFVGAMGLELWAEGDVAYGRAQIRPEMLAPTTGIARLSVLATLVDIVAGSPPSGMLNPTVDLRLTLVSRPPVAGPILLECRPAKVGRRLFVGETILHTGDPVRPFARSTCTFMNQRFGDAVGMFDPRPVVPLGVPTFDAMLDARPVRSGVLEMDMHPRVGNGEGGTIQGGAQALFAELAAEDALSGRGRFTAVDLDIRYLNRVRSDSVTATAAVLDGELADTCVRVAIEEAAPDARIVSLVSFLMQPV